MTRLFKGWGKLRAGIVGLAALAATMAFAPAQAHDGHYLYVLDNPNGPNAISTYWLAGSGHLSYIATTGIGGDGTGVGDLGSQGALQLGPNGRELFAVDAASNQVSMVRINGAHLTLVATFASGGVMPISLTFARNHLYVANAGDATHPANIANFVLHGDKMPTWVSDTALSVAAAGPAQVAANPDGDVFVVTEKATNSVDTFRIHSDGSLGDLHTRAAAGATPFGFAFNRRHDDQFVVSNAEGGAANASTVTTYALDGVTAKVADGPKADHQTAACWLVVTPNGKFAYTANFASGTVSGYHLASDGDLTLLNASGVTANTGVGSNPLEMAVTPDSHTFLVITPGASKLWSFAIGGVGQLAAEDAVGIPASSAGLALK